MTKESSVQVNEIHPLEILNTNVVIHPLKNIPECVFEPSETKKSVIEIKFDEKVCKRNLAIIQDEETFRIFENPELTKPKVTIIDYGKTLSTEYFMPGLARLMNKSSVQINPSNTIHVIGKIVATSRELVLNSTLVLKNILLAMRNDDIRDINELYLSDFYEMPAVHTRSISEARPWYNLERGIEARRACAALAHIASASDYLVNYVADNRKLGEPECEKFMNSHLAYGKRGFDFEFLELVLEFVSVVAITRRSHHYTGLLMAIMSPIINVQNRIGFTEPGLKRILSIFKEIVCSRPLLPCFSGMSSILRTFSGFSNFVNKLCISPAESGIYFWESSFNFTLDACSLEIFIAQLKQFKLDSITLINVTRDLAMFSNIALLNNSIPWIERTNYSCSCCMKLLLQFVITNLCERIKIDVEHVQQTFTDSGIAPGIFKHDVDPKKTGFVWRHVLLEDWSGFEEYHRGSFWETLEKSQYCAIAYGIRLLSFLAKRDLDFMVRVDAIKDAFHLLLRNLRKKKDFKLEKSDEVALDIVKEAFVLEKTKDENDIGPHVHSLLDLENEKRINFIGVEQDFKKLYQDPHGF